MGHPALLHKCDTFWQLTYEVTVLESATWIRKKFLDPDLESDYLKASAQSNRFLAGFPAQVE